MISTERRNDRIHLKDSRNGLPVFIHSSLDDVPLTSEAFRVYFHVVRWSGARCEHHCRSSYQDIGDKCFIVDCPENCAARREWAIAAVEELKRNDLIAGEEGSLVPTVRGLLNLQKGLGE